uniref:Putative metalloprotease n=1 Tax=Megacormus gertschi TaxID=1843536 RepID=A0A224XBN1_9SCOR
MSSNMTPFTDVEANGSKMRSSSVKSQKEKNLVAAVVILAIILFALVIAVIVLAIKDAKHSTHDSCKTAGCLTSALELVNSINTSYDPCDDFYEFACGKWAANYRGVGDSKMSRAGALHMFDVTDNIIQAAANPETPESVKKIATSYVTCSKYQELREQDTMWLLQLLQGVGGWPMTDESWEENKYMWERNLAMAIHDLFITTPILIGIDVNYFNTKKRIIHIQQHIIENLVPLTKDRILAVARNIGDRDDDPTLEKEYEEVEKLAELLKKMSHFDHELMDDPNERQEMTIKQLQEKIPWINWMEFIRTVFGSYLPSALYDSETVLVQGTTYMSKFLELAFRGNITKRTLANYIGASFIQSVLSVHQSVGSESSVVSPLPKFGKMQLPEGFSALCLNFYSTKASYAIDHITYKNRRTKLMDNKIIDYIFDAMKDIIKNAKWLQEKTSTAALEKLDALNYFSGFPDDAKDWRKVDEYYRGLPNITENSIRNQLNVEAHLFKRRAELLRKEVDRNIWPKEPGLHATQTNALNMGDENVIVIPAGIQLEPIFDANRPNYWNFGSLGYILGHEITHSFDSSGSKKDKHGNIKNWWTQVARENFEKRAKCFIEQYNKFSFGYKDYHVNGTRTLGENIADNGGLHQAYIAYTKWEKDNGKEKRLPGLENYDTHQLLYIAGAQPFCGIRLPPEEVYESSVSDVHSPTQFRFNAAVANSEDFARLFKCKSGSPMNPVSKCVIW